MVISKDLKTGKIIKKNKRVITKTWGIFWRVGANNDGKDRKGGFLKSW